MTDEIVDIQARLAFQEEAIQKLSDQIALQDRELLEAKKHIAWLREKLLDIVNEVDLLSNPMAQERPPHY